MLFPPHLDYLKDSNISWFNACYGFHGFWKHIREYMQKNSVSFSDAWKHRDIKRAKEIYVTSIAALAMREEESDTRPWWIAKPTQDPPDGLIMAVDERPNGNFLEVREIEVVEHLTGSITETILDKLRHKRYEKNTFLVCFLSSETGVYNLKAIHDELAGVKLPLDFIYLASIGGKLQAGVPMTTAAILDTASRVSFIQVYPQFVHLESRPYEVCVKWRDTAEASWIKLEGRSNKHGFRKITADNPPRLF